MADAQFDRTTVKIDISNTSEQFLAKGEVITFEGFMKVYLEGKDDDSEEKEGVFPKLVVREFLAISEALDQAINDLLYNLSANKPIE